MFNYLICVERNTLTDEQTVRSYRLNRIAAVKNGHITYSISSELKKLCRHTIETAPQFAMNCDVEICVKLNEIGEKLYNRIYFGRPKYRNIERRDDGIYYFFECSEDQAYQYFRRFDNDTALVQFPASLVQKIMEFHMNVVKAYTSNEKKGEIENA